MINCGWYLWLCGKKVYNIRQLRENFDTAALIGYYYGGTLSRWLKDTGEESILARIGQIDKTADIGAQLEYAFGVSPDKKAPEYLRHKENEAPDAAPALAPVNPVFNYPAYLRAEAALSSSFSSSFGSSFYSSFFGPGSFSNELSSSFYGLGSFSGGLSSSFYGLGSFTGGLSSSFFGLGSFTGGLSSSFYGLGSFTGGLLSSFFGLGSFAGGFTASYRGFLGLGSFGSWKLSSYRFGLGGYTGSMRGGSYTKGGSLLFGFGFSGGSAGSGGSFTGFTKRYLGGGSYVYSANGVTMTESEYKRTLINLSSCPLNAYGYGINLI